MDVAVSEQPGKQLNRQSQPPQGPREPQTLNQPSQPHLHKLQTHNRSTSTPNLKSVPAPSTPPMLQSVDPKRPSPRQYNSAGGAPSTGGSGGGSGTSTLTGTADGQPPAQPHTAHPESSEVAQVTGRSPRSSVSAGSSQAAGAGQLSSSAKVGDGSATPTAREPTPPPSGSVLAQLPSSIPRHQHAHNQPQPAQQPGLIGQSMTTPPDVPIETYLGETDSEFVVLVRAIPGTQVHLELQARSMLIRATLPPLSLAYPSAIAIRSPVQLECEKRVQFPSYVNANSYSKSYDKSASLLTVRIRKFVNINLGTETF